MSGKQRKTLIRICVAGALFAAALLTRGLWSGVPYLELAVFLGVYAVIGWDVVWKAARNIAHGQVFDENFLMCVASLGAFAIGEYPEAAAVVLFYQIGELFQSLAVSRSRKSIADLMEICPTAACVERDGEIVETDPEDVAPGDVVVVRPGERVPLDGVVLEGASMLDTSALTGESVPRSVRPGENVISGCINGQGLLRVRVTAAFEDSTVSRILELVENASARKARTENFITRFAAVYTPVVVVCAVLLAVVPPLFLGNWQDWLRRGCIFLVTSCPCALVISVPLSFFGGIGAASRRGILVKGGNFLEAAAKAGAVAMDKTGTLTKGEFAVQQICPAAGYSEEALLGLAAAAERYSDHPVAGAIRTRHTGSAAAVSDAEEIPGHGVRAVADGKEIWAGNDRLMEMAGVAYDACGAAGTVVHVAADGTYAGYLVIADRVKPEAAEAIAALRGLGVEETVMLTGDRRAAAEAAAGELGISQAISELLPGQKVEAVEGLLRTLEGSGKTLLFAGDGVNDAPVLTRADVGIAMGSLGSDAAVEAADVVLMDDDLRKIPLVIRIARKTVSIVRTNVAFALGVKLAVLILGAAGVAGMWSAVFADVGVTVLAVLNALRTLQIR